MLLKQQRNALLEVLLNQGFSTDQVIETVSADKYEVKLKDHLSLSFNVKRFANGGYWVSTRPGLGAELEYGAMHLPDWNALNRGFSKWASLLRLEYDAPDLWAEATKTAQLFAPTAEPSDDKFTRTELAEVQGQLRVLQLSFTQAALPEAAKQKLIELTETAAVKAEGLTKKDWQNWIIGGFISAITGLALNPAQASEVLKLVKAAFGGLFIH